MSLNSKLSEQIRWIKASLQTDYANLFKRHGALNEQIQQRLVDWQHKVRLNLLQKNPFIVHEKNLAKNKTGTFDQTLINDYQNFCQQIGIPSEKDFWQAELKKKMKKQKKTRKVCF